MSSIQSLFLPGPNGALYLSVFIPACRSDSAPWVVHVPAFAEEMNKSRPMVTRQARQMAESGFTVVVVDLSGTGDSEGHFGDATWNQWKEDLVYVLQWAMTQGAEGITLWGMRLGCLLAADVACQFDNVINGLLLWQPVHNGKQFMTQFLRLRMAASLMKGQSETVSQLRERLGHGDNIEVAGYDLSPELLLHVDSISISEFRAPRGFTVQIFEVVGDDKKPLLPVTQKLLDLWRTQGVDADASTVQGEPFWMTQEIGLAPSLLGHSGSFMQLLSAEKYPSVLSPSLECNAITDKPGEEGIVFDCGGAELVGILHPTRPACQTGVLIVVGGPQYRVGSHRQFVYLARYLASRGIPVFRFDYRGMGDSAGELRSFEQIHADIHCAVDAFFHTYGGLKGVVIWGLCDAATAALFYAPEDNRIKGLVLVNPWVYSTQGSAKAYLKHYYLERLFSKSLWQKIFRGEYNFGKSIKSFMGLAHQASGREPDRKESNVDSDSAVAQAAQGNSRSLVERFASSLSRFEGEVLLVLSGNDLTAAEFKDALQANRKLRKKLTASGVQREDFPGADHTFSESSWRVKVEQLSADWVKSL